MYTCVYIRVYVCVRPNKTSFMFYSPVDIEEGFFVNFLRSVEFLQLTMRYAPFSALYMQERLNPNSEEGTNLFPSYRFGLSCNPLDRTTVGGLWKPFDGQTKHKIFKTSNGLQFLFTQVTSTLSGVVVVRIREPRKEPLPLLLGGSVSGRNGR